MIRLYILYILKIAYYLYHILLTIFLPGLFLMPLLPSDLKFWHKYGIRCPKISYNSIILDSLIW